MQTSLTGRQQELRRLVEEFMRERQKAKTEKAAPDAPSLSTNPAHHDPAAWLAGAARRIRQIQLATHTLKATHSKAEGTSLYCPPSELPQRSVVGSHCLGDEFALDADGNAAALDVFKFLRLSHDGSTFLELARAADPDLMRALGDNASQAAEWMLAWRAFADAKRICATPASHGLAKQIYWPVGDDPHDDSSFHLLLPLYASSLAHRGYGVLQEHRFGDQAKAARAARKEGAFCEQPVYDYGELAVQKLGGTKPQNISQLNSERRGENYLLPSLPPVWQTKGPRSLKGRDSVLRVFERMPEVRELLRSLRAFLEADPDPTLETRHKRQGLVEELIDTLLQLAAAYRDQPPGWSAEPSHCLPEAERHWLDPIGFARQRAEEGRPLPTDTPEAVATAFANWLNARLSGKLSMGHPEFLEWRKLTLSELEAESLEVGDES